MPPQDSRSYVKPIRPSGPNQAAKNFTVVARIGNRPEILSQGRIVIYFLSYDLVTKLLKEANPIRITIIPLLVLLTFISNLINITISAYYK